MDIKNAKVCRKCGVQLNPEYGIYHDLCTACREEKGEVIEDYKPAKKYDDPFSGGSLKEDVIDSTDIPSDPLEIAKAQLKVLYNINGTLTFFKVLTIIALTVGVIVGFAVAAWMQG